jgi:DNA-binding CsgD family transcriptional regulator
VHAARAGLRIAQDEPAEALTILDSLGAGPEAYSGPVVPRLAKLRADALAKQGDYRAAEQVYLSAAAEARQLGALSLLWPIQAALSRLYDRSGDREKSRQAHAEATRVIEYIAGRMPGEESVTSFRAAALARLPSQRAPSPREAAKQAFGGLTEREREVARLIAAGQSNAAIAQVLVISERTAETHVTNILGKLGFASRSQIAAWAVERGLSDQPLS